jgi:acyl-CoA thioester hydrolase
MAVSPFSPKPTFRHTSAFNETAMIEHHDVTIRVRYAETDQMGVVYHSNYLIWFEVGRVEIMRSLGFDYKRMEMEDDTYMVVADAHCRYQHPAHYDEVIIVRTRILEAKNRTLKFGYEILRQSDQKLLANGHTIHVACSRAGRVKQFPNKYKQAFLAIASPCPADRSSHD